VAMVEELMEAIGGRIEVAGFFRVR